MHCGKPQVGPGYTGAVLEVSPCVECWAPCCQEGVILDEDDVTRLVKGGHGEHIMEVSGIKFLAKQNGDIDEAPCMLLIDGNCGGYEARPEICRQFPFTDAFPAGDDRCIENTEVSYGAATMSATSVPNALATSP